MCVRRSAGICGKLLAALYESFLAREGAFLTADKNRRQYFIVFVNSLIPFNRDQYGNKDQQRTPRWFVGCKFRILVRILVDFFCFRCLFFSVAPLSVRLRCLLQGHVERTEALQEADASGHVEVEHQPEPSSRDQLFRLRVFKLLLCCYLRLF